MHPCDARRPAPIGYYFEPGSPLVRMRATKRGVRVSWKTGYVGCYPPSTPHVWAVAHLFNDYTPDYTDPLLRIYGVITTPPVAIFN